ncbi:hypothetical protein CMI46_00510 [Candidatus Pacearchaeota archaeon]|nr:hypothetical protein [Candidatus Pacearchaeota archaeon]|tara:strand:- start:5446 stop:5928 length:483 start_codon:yes stop_codon:yes gene_type:complete
MSYKQYTSLDEALEDIDFHGTKTNDEFVFIADHFQSREEEDAFIESLEKVFNKIKTKYQGLPPYFMISELAKNAKRAVSKSTRKFRFETYSGKKGILIGTIQDDNFFTPDQISNLRRGNSVATTKKNGAGGYGTYELFNWGNGLLILEESNSIYVAKYLV